MLTELQLQRLYDRVELVPGVGDPRRGQLCIMSFVAYLAGEGHGDMPRTASSLIREFAIPVNDRVDTDTRQRLKPLAPRIIGTADGRDDQRAELLYRVVIEELAPEIFRRRDDATSRRGSSIEALGEVWGRIKDLPPAQLAAIVEQRRVGRRRLSDIIGGLVRGLRGSPQAASTADACAAAKLGLGALWQRRQRNEHCLVQALLDVIKARAGGKHGRMAAATAHLLLACASGAADRATAELYRHKAIDLLDRLCDVGAENRAAEIREERVAALEGFVAPPAASRAAAPAESIA